MSVKEFWEDNPDLFWAYRFSFYNKIKRENELFNHNAWLQGAYISEAVSVAISNTFGKGEIKYSEKPWDFEEKTEEEKVNEAVIDLKGRVAQVQALWKAKEQKERSEIDGTTNDRC